MPDKFPQKIRGFVRQDIVEPNARTHKHLLDSRQFPQGAQDIHIFPMIGFEIFARPGKQALPPLARAGLQLFFAGGAAEIGRGAADIVDISLEIRIAQKAPAPL